MTCACGAAIFCSAASACSALDSWTTPTTALSNTMNMMAKESTYSPSASDTTAAMIRMIDEEILELIPQQGQKTGPRPLGEFVAAKPGDALLRLGLRQAALQVRLEVTDQFVNGFAVGLSLSCMPVSSTSSDFPGRCLPACLSNAVG
jgi:hypothetical protein